MMRQLPGGDGEENWLDISGVIVLLSSQEGSHDESGKISGKNLVLGGEI